MSAGYSFYILSRIDWSLGGVGGSVSTFSLEEEGANQSGSSVEYSTQDSGITHDTIRVITVN